MAERLADISARIESIQQLQAVTTAMRGIAAARTQQSRALLGGIAAYAETIGGAIGQALNLIPIVSARKFERTNERALIMFCAEQGFAGALNDRIFNRAAKDLTGTHLLIAGTRGAAIARERGLVPSWAGAMASQVGSIPEVANRVADALYRLVDAARVKRAEILFARVAENRSVEIVRRSLLPLDLERFRQPEPGIPPLTTLAPEILIESLAAEYVYATLCEAAMQAFAAENQARMEAMSTAAGNIDHRLRELKLRENQIRQEEVTAEIVELASAVEAARR